MVDWVMVLLLALGALLNLLLLRQSLRGGGLPGCGSGSGCDATARSRWSRLGTVPVALPGLLVYLLMLGAKVASMADTLASFGRVADQILLTGGGVLFGAALWFTCLQLLVVRRVCWYCLVLHFTGLAVAGLILGPIISAAGHGLNAANPPMVGGGLAVLLVLGQLVLPARTYRVQVMPEADMPDSQADEKRTLAARTEPTETPAAPELSRSDGNVAPAAAPPREVSLLGGRVVLKIGDWPLLGSPSAPQVIACLFDYTCDSCRETHRLLHEVLADMAGELAVLSIPVPLDRACNPSAPVEPGHEHACTYAKLALAVWRHVPEHFADFDAWLFWEPAPAVREVEARAARLVGRLAAEAAASEAVQNGLREAVAVHAASGPANLPKLLLPKAMVVGQVPSKADLLRIVRDEAVRSVGTATTATSAPVAGRAEKAAVFSNRPIQG